MATTIPPTSLQDIAKMKGYNLNYDPNSKQVTILNPKTNQSINFQSGQGQEYGLGGLVGGSNVVSNLSALDKALNQAPTPVNNPAPYTKDTPLLYPTMGGTPATNATPPPVAAPTLTAGQPTQTDQTLGQQLGQIPVAQATPTPSYTSPYQNQIGSLLEQLTKQITSPTQYKPNTDAGLQQAQEQARNQALQEMARRGLLYSEGTKTRMQQAGQQLIPQYEQLFRQQQQQQTQNIGDLLGTLSGLEQAGYQRYQNQLASQQQAQQQQFANKVTEAGLTGQYQGTPTLEGQQVELQKQKFYTDTFGRFMSPETMQRITTPIPQEYKATVAQYNNDYAGEINKRMAANPNDPLIPYLQSARAQKIFSDPSLLIKYGAEYGLPTMDSIIQAKQAEGLDMKNISDSLNLQILPKRLEQELTMNEQNILANDLKNTMSQYQLQYMDENQKIAIAQAKQALEKGSLENAYQAIINSNLPEKLKSEIAQNFASAKATADNVKLREKEFKLDEAKQAFTQSKQSSEDENKLVDNVSKYIDSAFTSEQTDDSSDIKTNKKVLDKEGIEDYVDNYFQSLLDSGVNGNTAKNIADELYARYNIKKTPATDQKKK